MVENQFEARRAILVGDVGDIRHQRNAAVLRNNSLNPNVAIEFYSSQNGIVAGLKFIIQTAIDWEIKLKNEQLS